MISRTIPDFLWNLYTKIMHIINVRVLPQSVKKYILYNKPLKVLCKIFIIHPHNKKLTKRNKVNPTNQMLESRDFFSTKMDRVNNVASYLFDDASKNCYQKMIDFRCNSDWIDFPPVSQNQYFDDEYFTYGISEIYVDCGAYNGDSINEFKKTVKKHKGDYSRIVAFEPSELCDILTSNHKDVVAIRAGAWSHDDTLMFNNNVDKTKTLNKAGDIIGGGGIAYMPVRSIDNCPECEGVTFLKMDIEGAEMEALQGAVNTIATYKPKLAICIYHSDEDMIRIAEWIHDNFPEYRLFVKQHSKYRIYETVLYGLVEE